jgi:uncharacterized protein
MNQTEKHRPWYLEGYVWLVIFFPATAVVAGVITAVLAVQSDDGLVVDDYYKKGLAINRTLERDRFAEELGFKSTLQYTKENENFRLILTSESGFEFPERLKLSFLNASRAGIDKEIELMKSSANTYIAPRPELRRGKWHVLIEDDEWRLLSVLQIP